MRQPITRDVREIVRALEIVEAEFAFQADRIRQRVPRPGESENMNSDHLPRLAAGYDEASQHAKMLRRYHRGRLERAEAANASGISETDQRDAISSSGTARAYTTE
jgi:hypothetical protein